MAPGTRLHSVSARSKHLSPCELFFSKHKHKEIMHMLSWLNLGTPTCSTFQQNEKDLGLIPGGGCIRDVDKASGVNSRCSQ